MIIHHIRVHIPFNIFIYPHWVSLGSHFGTEPVIAHTCLPTRSSRLNYYPFVYFLVTVKPRRRNSRVPTRERHRSSGTGACGRNRPMTHGQTNFLLTIIFGFYFFPECWCWVCWDDVTGFVERHARDGVYPRASSVYVHRGRPLQCGTIPNQGRYL